MSIKRGWTKIKKKIYYIVILFVFLLFVVSCSDIDREYEKFLSDKEGKYSLYIASDKEDIVTFDTLDEEDITSVKTITQETKLRDVRLEEVKEMPTFIVFDTKNKIYKTNNIDELVEFLHDNEK